MGVSLNGGTPKWMVKIMENPIKIDDLGVPLFSETSIYSFQVFPVEISTGTVMPAADHDATHELCISNLKGPRKLIDFYWKEQSTKQGLAN